MIDTVVVPRRFAGPPGSANGGWVSGLLAGYVEGAGVTGPAGSAPVTVRLRRPPPLDTPLGVARAADEGVELRYGEDIVAHAALASTDMVDDDAVPTAVSYADAVEAGRLYAGLQVHPFPGCFVCGTDREPGDGLRLQTGPVRGREPLHAAAWTPEVVTPELVWAALDCPGAWASGFAGRRMVLGTMTAQVLRLPAAGEPHVVLAWPQSFQGRRYWSGTALLDGHGALLARAEAVWVDISGRPGIPES